MKSNSAALMMVVLAVSGSYLHGATATEQSATGTSLGKSLVTMPGNPEGNENTGSTGSSDKNESNKEEDILKEVQGINTIDTTSGNWLLKRAWWEKTEEVYEQLKETVSSVMGMRANFVSQRNESDRALDILFSEVGVEQGVLLDTVAYAKDLIDKEKLQNVLSPQEKEFAQKVAGKERELEQLKSDIKGIDEIDNKIDQALDVFFAQIDLCNKYEHKAWENFKDIARELNDKEARKLYYNTEALYKDVKNIKQYLENDFKQYFDSLLQKGREHSQKISAQVNALKASGVDIKKESRLLEKENVEAEQEKIKNKIAIQEKKKLEEAEKRHKEELLKANSLYSVKNIFDGIWKTIKDMFIRVSSYLGPVGNLVSSIGENIGQAWGSLREFVITKISGTGSSIKPKSADKKINPGSSTTVSKVVSDVEKNSDKAKEVIGVQDKKKSESEKVLQQDVIKKEVSKAPSKTIKMPNQKPASMQKKSETVMLTAQDSKPIDYYEKPQVDNSNSDLSYYGVNQI